MTKDETSLGLISCKSWRGKLQPAFMWNLGHNLCLKRAQPKTMELGFHSPTSTSYSSCNNTQLVSPSPCIRYSKDKRKVTPEAKDTKAQENKASDNVLISAPTLSSPAPYLESCRSRETHGSLQVIFFFFSKLIFNVYRSIVYLQYSINISCMGN